jgi:hypothetical protein
MYVPFYFATKAQSTETAVSGHRTTTLHLSNGQQWSLQLKTIRYNQLWRVTTKAFTPNLTFIGQCIAIYFYSKSNKMQQLLKLSYFWDNTLHVSDGLTVHHQEFKTVHTATGICQTGRLHLKCDGTRAETRFRLSTKRTSPFKSAGGVSSVDYWQASSANQPAGFVLHVQACVLQSCDTYWSPTPFSCFPFTSPPVRHRVPSHVKRCLLLSAF